jgi:uncharacterized protein YndB with AHSA1/START domain
MASIEQTIEVQAPRERVFEALTEADELERWFPSGADSDARTGGAFEYRFRFPAEPERDHRYGGTYHEVRAGEHVSYPWAGALGVTRRPCASSIAAGGTARSGTTRDGRTRRAGPSSWAT